MSVIFIVPLKFNQLMNMEFTLVGRELFLPPMVCRGGEVTGGQSACRNLFQVSPDVLFW